MRNAAPFERDRPEPVLIYAATPGRGVARTMVLVLLAWAPLAIGAAYPAAYVPLLAGCFGLGAYSLNRTRQLRASGVPVTAIPGVRGLLALWGLVALQLVPLPPRLLSWISPGSFAFYNDFSLVPLRRWCPITASAPDTARGLVFLVAMTLLYTSVYREFDHPAWRRRLGRTIVAVGFVMTIEALVQQAYAAHVIYGVYKPRWDWMVFGPYLNRNLFAGYMLMVVPLAACLAAESLDDLRRAWRRRRRGWIALGDPEASTFFRHVAVAMVVVVGLLATGSRGSLVGLATWVVTMPLAARRRWPALLAVLLIVGLGFAWLGFGGYEASFRARGLVDHPRLLIWADALRLFRLSPITGSGFNAFGTALPPRQTAFKSEWIGTTHDEYLQVLVDLGVLGLVPAAILLGQLLRNGARVARQSVFHAGLFASILAVLAHNLVDCNWQLPANAATFVALAAIAMQPLAPGAPLVGGRRSGSRDEKSRRLESSQVSA